MRLSRIQAATVVWLLLAGGTGLSWWLGSVHAEAAPFEDAQSPANWVAAGLLAVGVVKVRLIVFQFMEVRDAPRALRLVCDGWIALVAVGLVLTYRLAGPG